MVHHRQQTQIRADADAVFRLLVAVEEWPALFPHVRSFQANAGGRNRVTLVWRGIPAGVLMSARVDPERQTLEQRFGSAWVRAGCLWAVEPASEGQCLLRCETRLASAPPVLNVIAGRMLSELVDHTIAMVSLIAESDRLAHENIR